MGARGPKPKPTALRKLEGVRKHAAINHAEPKFESILPDRPEILDLVGGAVWDRLAPPLAAQGLLTTADVETLTTYCHSYSRYLEAEKGVTELGLVVKTPKGVIQLNPYVAASKKYLADMNRAASELGLTPASRVRLMAVVTDPGTKASRQEDEIDALDVLLTEVEGDV